MAYVGFFSIKITPLVLKNHKRDPDEIGYEFVLTVLH